MPLRDRQILCERTAPTTAKMENGFKNKNFIVLTNLAHPARPSYTSDWHNVIEVSAFKSLS